MKRRALDAIDLLARLFDAAHMEDDHDEEDGDSTDLAPGAPPPPGDPRLGMRVLARLVAVETAAGAPRRRRREPIRAFATPSQAKLRVC